jgi:hypothetical protein
MLHFCSNTWEWNVIFSACVGAAANRDKQAYNFARLEGSP